MKNKNITRLAITSILGILSAISGAAAAELVKTFVKDRDKTS